MEKLKQINTRTIVTYRVQYTTYKNKQCLIVVDFTLYNPYFLIEDNYCYIFNSLLTE